MRTYEWTGLYPNYTYIASYSISTSNELKHLKMHIALRVTFAYICFIHWMSPTVFKFCTRLFLKSFRPEIKKMDSWVFSTIKISYNPVQQCMSNECTTWLLAVKKHDLTIKWGRTMRGNTTEATDYVAKNQI